MTSEWRSGWRVTVAGAVCFGTGSALFFMTAGLFIAPMQQELGWSRAAVTLAAPVSVISAVANPFAGAASDRWGGRRVALWGLALLAATYCTLALTPGTPLSIYIGVLALGLVGSMTQVAPIASCVAAWFSRSTATAFGLVFNGVALTAIVAVPIVSFAIYELGWRAGFAVLGLFCLVGLPVAGAWLRPPDSQPANENASPVAAPKGANRGDVLRDWRFWIVSGAIAAAAMSAGGFLAHFVPILIQKSFGLAEATSLSVIYVIALGVGKVGSGILFDRWWDWGVAVSLLALAGIAGLFFQPLSTSMPLPLVAMIIILVALGHGSVSVMTAYFPLRLFGRRIYSFITGITVMVALLGSAAGGLLFAVLHDAQHNYDGATAVGGAGFLLASILLLVCGLSERRARMLSARAE